jgi:cytochrome c biogenesis protein CcdA
MIGNLTLEGSQDIQRYLERIVSLQQNKSESTGLFFSNARNFVSSSQGIPLILIFGAGLVDGINPCAFAVLVLMLISLMKQKTRNAMFIAGITYITAVFIFYLLSGIGIFSVIQTAGITNAFSFIAGCITCIAGILMLKDALKPGDRSLLGISPSHMGVIQQLMKIATLPSAFILGILVGIFELPCTGGIYLSILSMISLKSSFSQAFGYLILYNLAFIIPLVCILVLVAFGLPPERVNTWRLEQRQRLKGIIGVVLIGFALYIFTLNMGDFFIW